MDDRQIRFDDGAAYERMMGQWSRLVGHDFLDWLSPAPNARWVDVGCGNGAFTELVAARCSPAAIEGIDPSPGQIAYAETRPGIGPARFRLGDAAALPFADASFDVAVMALVIFFVPEPEKGVAEMRRVVRPGGTVAAYAWDIPGGGFPLEPIFEEVKAFGIDPLRPPRAEVSSLAELERLWRGAGLEDVGTRAFTVARRFADFEDLWTACLSGNLVDRVRALPPEDIERLRERLRARLPADAQGRISYEARANAVTGRVAG